MAHPIRKRSNARQGSTRAHWKLGLPSMTRCAQCAQPVLSHRVCPHCGYYRGKPVIVVRERKADKT